MRWSRPGQRASCSPLGDGVVAHIEAGKQPGADGGKRRVLDLMAAGEGGQRVTPLTALVLDDQIRISALERPLPAEPRERRPYPAPRPRSMTASASASCRPITPVTPCFRIPAFSAAMRGSVSPR